MELFVVGSGSNDGSAEAIGLTFSRVIPIERPFLTSKIIRKIAKIWRNISDPLGLGDVVEYILRKDQGQEDCF